MDNTSPQNTFPEELFSLNKLSRKLDISYPRALQLVAENKLTPDFMADRNYLFRPARLPEFRSLVESLAQ